MPHAFYSLAWVLCPWPGCGFRAEMIDFRLEVSEDKARYARVILAWGRQADYGIIARCPGCHQYVWFGKRAISDLPAGGFELLPDDWYLTAEIRDVL